MNLSCLALYNHLFLSVDIERRLELYSALIGSDQMGLDYEEVILSLPPI